MQCNTQLVVHLINSSYSDTLEVAEIILRLLFFISLVSQTSTMGSRQDYICFQGWFPFRELSGPSLLRFSSSTGLCSSNLDHSLSHLKKGSPILNFLAAKDAAVLQLLLHPTTTSQMPEAPQRKGRFGGTQRSRSCRHRSPPVPSPSLPLSLLRNGQPPCPKSVQCLWPLTSHWCHIAASGWFALQLGRCWNRAVRLNCPRTTGPGGRRIEP